MIAKSSIYDCRSSPLHGSSDYNFIPKTLCKVARARTHINTLSVHLLSSYIIPSRLRPPSVMELPSHHCQREVNQLLLKCGGEQYVGDLPFLLIRPKWLAVLLSLGLSSQKRNMRLRVSDVTQLYMYGLYMRFIYLND